MGIWGTNSSACHFLVLIIPSPWMVSRVDGRATFINGPSIVNNFTAPKAWVVGVEACVAGGSCSRGPARGPAGVSPCVNSEGGTHIPYRLGTF